MASLLIVIFGLLKIVIAQTIEECPNPVECFVNPCLAATCPNYEDAICTPNYCFGECRAEFYLPTGREVTDKCEIPSCKTRVCPENRPVCIEERVPCPNNKTTCVPSKQVKVTCERLIMALPSNCDMVVCADTQRCDIDEAAEGPVARCVHKLPERCNEINCGLGTECRERVKDGIMFAKCVPQRVDAEDCSTVTCPVNTMCELTGAGRPRCVEKPPPSNCAELICEEGYSCVVRNEMRAICIQTQINRTQPTLLQELITKEIVGKQCSDLFCIAGYHCVLFGDINQLGNAFIPRCVPDSCPLRRPPLTCREMQCGPDEYCLVMPENRGQPTPRCLSYYGETLYVFTDVGLCC